MYKLPYHVSNGGDGSANVHFHTSLAAAEQADESQSEGWGESSAGEVMLKVEDGKLYFRDYQRVEGKYQFVWSEVPQA